MKASGDQGERGPRRLRGLPVVELLGERVPLAVSPLSRLLGLALLDRARAGSGLLIPDCRSVHTLGMRFPLDVLFLDRDRRVLRRRSRVGPWRLLLEPRAVAVLERPAR
jgi:uncharacterized membrane protein (UPF0127 family)